MWQVSIRAREARGVGAKVDRLPQEVGLRLFKRLGVPKALPAFVLIRNHHNDADWRHFLSA